jgi:N-acyl homoserine lactone hydrolase
MSTNTALKLVPLEIGRLDLDLSDLVGTQEMLRVPVPSWLIEHPNGLILFDAGLHKGLQDGTTTAPALFGEMPLDFRTGEELSARLEQHGYSASDVAVVILSHLHFDHVGGIGELPNARLVVQRSEWSAGHHPHLVEIGYYDPDQFDLGHDVQQIEAEHDVLGDASLVCIPTPGHTKGHQALRVSLPSGPVVLTADCVYFARMLDEMRAPRFAFNAEQQLESMRVLKRLRDEDGCRLIFGHDPEQFAAEQAAALA